MIRTASTPSSRAGADGLVRQDPNSSSSGPGSDAHGHHLSRPRPVGGLPARLSGPGGPVLRPPALPAASRLGRPGRRPSSPAPVPCFPCALPGPGRAFLAFLGFPRPRPPCRCRCPVLGPVVRPSGLPGRRLLPPPSALPGASCRSRCPGLPVVRPACRCAPRSWPSPQALPGQHLPAREWAVAIDEPTSSKDRSMTPS